VQLFTHIYQLKLIPPTGIYNDYNGDLALDADFPIVYFNDTTLNGICAFDPCHLLLYNGHTVEPSKIYGGYMK